MDSNLEYLRSAGASEARRLREQACKGGLRFEAYLPPDLAEWLLGLIERGVFMSPSEAVFAILGEHRELEPHTDLRDELLRRMVLAAADDPAPCLTSDEVMAKIVQRSATQEAPAIW